MKENSEILSSSTSKIIVESQTKQSEKEIQCKSLGTENYSISENTKYNLDKPRLYVVTKKKVPNLDIHAIKHRRDVSGNNRFSQTKQIILTPKDFIREQMVIGLKTTRRKSKISKQKTCIPISKELFDREETKSFLNSKFCEGMLISIVGYDKKQIWRNHNIKVEDNYNDFKMSLEHPQMLQVAQKIK